MECLLYPQFAPLKSFQQSPGKYIYCYIPFPFLTDFSNFLAGDSQRLSRRYHALDKTVIFGCGCCHEFPRLFINLRHGEQSVVL